MNNVIKFPKSSPRSASVMTQQHAIQLYAAMMNLYSGVNVSVASNKDLVQFLVNNPQGLPADQTLVAASMISKNVELMQNMQKSVAIMMRFLMDQSNFSVADMIMNEYPQAPDDPAA